MCGVVNGNSNNKTTTEAAATTTTTTEAGRCCFCGIVIVSSVVVVCCVVVVRVVVVLPCHRMRTRIFPVHVTVAVLPRSCECAHHWRRVLQSAHTVHYNTNEHTLTRHVSAFIYIREWMPMLPTPHRDPGTSSLNRLMAAPCTP